MNAPHDAVFAEVVRHGIANDCPVEPHEVKGIHEDIDETLPTVLAALRAAAGADRVVLCWDGDECTLHGLVPATVENVCFFQTRCIGLFTNEPAFLLTDVAVTSPEEDR